MDSFSYFFDPFGFRARRRRAAEQAHATFARAIVNAVRAETAPDLQTVESLFSGATGLDNDHPYFRSRLASALKRVATAVAAQADYGDTQKRLLIPRLEAFIREIERQEPYADLPVGERSALVDIDTFLDKDDIPAVKRKLAEIVALIRGRQDTIDELTASQERSARMAVYSLVAAVGFGVLSAATNVLLWLRA